MFLTQWLNFNVVGLEVLYLQTQHGISPETPEFFSSSFAQTTIRDFIAFPKNNMGSSVINKKSSFF